MIKRNWIEEYRENYLETRFVSQLPAFLISIFSLFSLFGTLHAGYLFPEYVKDHFNFFWISIAFQILTIIFFVPRFILLFFNSAKTFWLAQLFWVFILINLYAWCAYTNYSFYSFFYETLQPSKSTTISFDEFPQTNLSLASNILDYLATLYFFLSPIRQFLTLIISAFKRW